MIIFENLYMNWGLMGLDNMVQAFQSWRFLVDQVQVYWIMQGTLSRPWPVFKEGTGSLQPGFCVRSGSSDSIEKPHTSLLRNLWNRPQEGGGRVQRQNWTPGRSFACDASQEQVSQFDVWSWQGWQSWGASSTS